GNWKLEFAAGRIESRLAVSDAEQAEWAGLLAAPVLDLNGPATFTASDGFPSETYSGGAGWTSGWTEFDASPSRFVAGTSNSDNSPASGNVLYGTRAGGGNEMAIVGHASQSGDSIQRSVNLLAYTSATLSFDYRLQNVESPDAVQVQVSNNGGATFASLATYTTNGSGSASFDISPYISDKTVIRFKVTGGFETNDDRFFFDNVQITANGNNYDTTFTEGGAPVAVAGSATTVTDPDGSLLQGATVTLANAQAGDILAISGVLPGGIAGSVSGNTVTLSGSASGANYADAIKLITFSNTSAAPSTTTRTLSIQATDATDEVSLVATSYVRVVSVDSPALAQPDTFTGPNFGSITGNVLLDNGAGADSDIDAVAPLTVATTPVTSPTQGTLVLNSDGTFTYTPTGAGTYTDTFQYRLISLAQVPGTSYEYWNVGPSSYTATTGLIPNFPSGPPNATGFLSGFDVDQAALNYGNTSLNNFTVRFTTQFDVTAGGTYTFYAGSDDGAIVYVDGTLVANNDGAHSYQERSGTIALTPGRHTLRVDFFEIGGQEDLVVSYAGADTAGIRTDMSGAVGLLAPSHSTGTVTINIVAGAPRLGTGSTLNYTENQAAAVVNGVITVTDPDTTTLASATVAIASNFAAGQDVLGFVNGAGMGNIAGSYNAATGVLTLTSAGATATLAQWQAALRAVTYLNASDAP
ncbi:MAG TPA: PA14 domain-containing protein, partial [Gammaproteobacteria bacterium]